MMPAPTSQPEPKPPSTSDEDARDLAAWCEHRDERAFAALLSRYASLVHGVCRRRLGDNADADVATQAAFLVLARKATQVHPGKLGTWLYGVALRTSHTVERTRKRRQRRECEIPMHDQAAQPVPAEAEWSQIRPHLDMALASLGEGNRRALIGHFLQGRQLGEIAQDLGISPDAARMRINAGLEKLRRWFGKRGLKIGAGVLLIGLAEDAAAAPPDILPVILHPNASSATALIARSVTLRMFAMKSAIIAASLFLLICGVLAVHRSIEVSEGVSLSSMPSAVRLDQPLVVEDAAISLSPALRDLVGLEDIQAGLVEQALNTAYDSYRSLLAKIPPAVARTGELVTLTFRDMNAPMLELQDELDRSLKRLAENRNLSDAQSVLLLRAIEDPLHTIIPDLPRMTSYGPHGKIVDMRSITSHTLQISRMQTDDGASNWLIATSLSYDTHGYFGASYPCSHSHSATSIELPENIRIFLPYAGIFDPRPLPASGSVRRPHHLAVRSVPERVPLGVIAKGLEEGSLHLEVLHSANLVLDRKGRVAPSAWIKAFCGLDSKQADAVTTAWTTIFDAYRVVLNSHPPQVTSQGKTSIVLRFSSLNALLMPLREQAERALDPLVATGTLRSDQATVLKCLSRIGFASLTFDWGRLLESVAITRSDVWSWNCASAFGSDVGSGRLLDDEYRAILTFIPFAADEALPSTTAKPAR